MMTHKILQQAEPNSQQRPRIHVSGSTPPLPLASEG